MEQLQWLNSCKVARQEPVKGTVEVAEVMELEACSTSASLDPLVQILWVVRVVVQTVPCGRDYEDYFVLPDNLGVSVIMLMLVHLAESVTFSVLQLSAILAP